MLMDDTSAVTSNGVAGGQDGGTLLVRVEVPDVKTVKCIVVNPNDSVWAAKQVVMEKINQDLPRDPFNYSLYMPPAGSGRLGKYMEDGRPLLDYSLQGSIPKLELKYKARDYSTQVALTKKDIVKANSKSNQKKLLDYISSGAKKKMEKLLEAGLDPNFITEDGNTPLGIACGRNSHVVCITSVLSGGAHIDFRGLGSLTPMHRAAIGGNAQAIMVLLSYGASPNYRDAKGYTPVYHTAIMGDDTSACESLLHHRAELGTTEQGGWTELHQTSKYGHVRHADLFIRYGADINAQNLVGNTPLHVAASHGQTGCAMKLLKRGADKMKLNFSSQTPGQVAVVCGHHKLAAEINGFSPEQMEPITEPPVYNSNARKFDSELFVQKSVSETCPISPPAEVLVGALAEEWVEKVADIPEPPQLVPVSKRKMSTTGSTSSLNSRSSSNRIPDSVDTGSMSSMDPEGENTSTNSESTGGVPGDGSPLLIARHNYTFAHTRERLYKAGPGRYTVVESVEPQQTGDIPLRRGMLVEVLFIGKGGFWEGRAGGRQGWFPALAIKEITSEEDFLAIPELVSPLVDSWKAKGGQEKQKVVQAMEVEREDEEEVERTDTVTELEHGLTDGSERRPSNIREIVVRKGHRGFGFAMRGVKATKSMKFSPSPQVPALQYVGNIDEGGAADLAGLETGDFIIEVNGHNVTYSTHDDVVNIVRISNGTLVMKVITPLIKPKSTSTSIRQQLTPISTPDRPRRSNRPQGSPRPTKDHTSSSTSSYLGRAVVNESRLKPGTANFRLQNSPIIGGIKKSGWDSSQSQEDVTVDFASQPVPISVGSDTTTPSRFAFHVPPSASAVRDTGGVKAYPISESSSQPSPVLGQSLAGMVPERYGQSQYNAGAFSQPTPSFSPQLSAVMPKEKSTRSYSISTASSSRGTTLPQLPPRDYPSLTEKVELTDLSHGSESPKGESDSFFTQQIKAGKETLQRQPKYGMAHRQRASTLPALYSSSHSEREQSQRGLKKEKAFDKGYSVSEEEIEEEEEEAEKKEVENRKSAEMHQKHEEKHLTEFERELMKARENRSQRISSNKPRLTQVSPEDEEEERRISASITRNPIANAVLRKIDSVVLDKSRYSDSDDDFSSPNSSPDCRFKAVTKVPPPTKAKTPPPVLPKPSTIARSGSSPDDVVKTVATSTDGATDDRANPPPWVMKLRSTAKAERKYLGGEADSDKAKTDQIDWRSGLKPVSRVKADTVSHSPNSINESSSTSTRQQRQALPLSPQSPATPVAKMFDPPVSPQVVSPEAGSNMYPLPSQSSTDGIAFDDNGRSIPAAKYYQPTSTDSFDGSYWTQGGERTEIEALYDRHPSSEIDLPLPLPELYDHESQDTLISDHLLPEADGFEAGELPPPLDPLESRFSTTSFDLPPPDDFDSFDGVHEDSLVLQPIIPPSAFLDPEEPQSPLPPPLPQTSPPSALPAFNQSFTFVTSSELPRGDEDREKLPSPIPSPEKSTSSISAFHRNPAFHQSIPPTAFAEGNTQSRKEDKPVDEADVPPPLPSEPPPPLDFNQDESSQSVQPHPLVSPDNEQSPELTESDQQYGQPPSQLQLPTQQESVLDKPVDISLLVGPKAITPLRPPPPTSESLSPSQLETAGQISRNGQDSSAEVLEAHSCLDPSNTTVKAEEATGVADKPRTAMEWTTDDVCQWLRDIGLGEHCGQFIENDIMGEHLAELSKDDLKELGVKKLGHQKTFTSKVKEIFD